MRNAECGIAAVSLPTNLHFQVHGFKERKSVVRGSLTPSPVAGERESRSRRVGIPRGIRALSPLPDSALDAKDLQTAHHPLPQPQNRPPLPKGEERGEGVRNSGNSPAVKISRATPFRSPQVHPRALPWTAQIQSGVVIRPCYPRILPPHSKIPRATIFEIDLLVTYVCGWSQGLPALMHSFSKHKSY